MSLNMTNISYVHIDVMDGKFVPSVQFDNMDEIRDINSVTKYPMDVHLMMDNPADYIKELGNMNIEFITIHLEIDKDKKEIFKSIRDLGYKVGLSIKPNTSVEEIVPHLDDIDMVLVMSVEPGLGGQKFIEGTVDRIRKLKELIGERNILIEVDGGINKDNIAKLDNVDIAVVGSYITKSDNYKNSVDELLGNKSNSIIKVIIDKIKKTYR
jgi:ribulose-phosphate 3-epimerase